jgi:hypothetical protein
VVRVIQADADQVAHPAHGRKSFGPLSR